MIKYFCDVCQKELETDKIKGQIIGGNQIMMCEECDKKLQEKVEEMKKELQK